MSSQVALQMELGLEADAVLLGFLLQVIQPGVLHAPWGTEATTANGTKWKFGLSVNWVSGNCVKAHHLDTIVGTSTLEVAVEQLPQHTILKKWSADPNKKQSIWYQGTLKVVWWIYFEADALHQTEAWITKDAAREQEMTHWNINQCYQTLSHHLSSSLKGTL